MYYRHPTEIPRSKELTDLEWIGERIPVSEKGIRGDTYPTAWAADDQLYVGTGDPCWTKVDGQIVHGNIPERPELNETIFQQICGHVVEKIVGGPEQFTMERIHHLPGQTGWGGSGPKPAGMISVDGVLYYAAQNYLGWRAPRYGVNSQHGSDATILRSDDFGKTWSPDLDGLLYPYYKEHYDCTNPDHHTAWDNAPEDRNSINGWKPMFVGCWFGGPAFVQFGQDNRDAVDGYVYAVSSDHWDNGSELRLGRVPKECIQDRSRWEFARWEGEQVAWTSDLTLSQPVLTIDRHISTPEMVYLSGLKKYLLFTWGLHTDFHASDGAELTVLESDHPWGPFRLVHYEWMWGKQEGGHYCPRLPLKWFDQETLTGYLLYSGNWETQDQDTYYMPQVRKFKLIHP